MTCALCVSQPDCSHFSCNYEVSFSFFSSAGMTPQQVKNMTEKWHVYMTADGRISLAGLNKAKAEYLARAMDDSIRNH